MSQPFSKKIARIYAAVFVSAIAGGAGFVFMKDSVAVFPVPWFTFWRFFLSAAALFPFFVKKTWNVATPRMLADGFVVGSLFCAATLIQLQGIAHTDAGRSAFINSASIVITPVLQALLTRRMPSFKTLAGCFLCLFGVGFLALQKMTGRSNLGAELLVFAGTFLFAVQIVAFSWMLRRNDPAVLSFLQFFCTALTALPVALFYPFPSFLEAGKAWQGVFYAAFAMNIGMIMITYNALRTISPTSVMAIGSTQAIYGAFFGALLLNEAITWEFAVSAGLILTGVMIVIFAVRSPRGDEKVP